MILTTTNNETIILQITGYAEGYVVNDDVIDANWLYVYIRIVRENAIECFGRELTTWDLLELKNWLNAIANNELVAEKRFDFVEQDLNLHLLGSENECVNRFSFSSERATDEYLFELSNDELMKIVATVSKEISFFPERTIEDRQKKSIVNYPLVLQKTSLMKSYESDPYNLIIPKGGKNANKETTPLLVNTIVLNYSVLELALLEKKFFMLEKELKTIVSECFNDIIALIEDGFVKFIDFPNNISLIQHCEIVLADRCKQHLNKIYRNNEIRINGIELKFTNTTNNDLSGNFT